MPRRLTTTAGLVLTTMLLALTTLSVVPTASQGSEPSTDASARLRYTTVRAVPSATSVVVGTPVSITGVASGGRRPVVLEVRVVGGWRKVSSGRTNANRAYRVAVPTGFYATHQLRVRAPATGGYARGVSPVVTVRVRPSYTPVGSSSEYAIPFRNWRWNPCASISWRFNATGGFAGSIGVVKRAMDEVTRATGLRFRYAGSTTKIPFRDDVRAVADLVIAWATPEQVAQLQGGTAGYAYANGYGPTPQRQEIWLGRIALDSTADLAEAYAAAGQVAWGQVIVHELGHAIGVGHVDAVDQLMNPDLTTANSRLGAGDLVGMHKVGLTQGCWDQGARGRGRRGVTRGAGSR